MINQLYAVVRPAGDHPREHAMGQVEGGMEDLKRITFNPTVMGGKPCIRGMRVTVGMIVGLVASGHDRHTILEMYPYLEPDDIIEALRYAAWRVEEIDVPLQTAMA